MNSVMEYPIEYRSELGPVDDTWEEITIVWLDIPLYNTTIEPMVTE